MISGQDIAPAAVTGRARGIPPQRPNKLLHLLQLQSMCLSSARFCEESMQSMQSMLMQGYIPVAEYAINRVVSPKLRCLRSSEFVAFPRLGSQLSTRTASKTNGTTDLCNSGGQHDMTMESSGVLVFQGHFWCFLVTLCFLVILFYSVLWN